MNLDWICKENLSSVQIPNIHKLKEFMEIENTSSPKKFKELLGIFAEVFEMENFNIPSDVYLEHLVKKDDLIVIIAKHEESVVGGLTIYRLMNYYSEKPLAYIYDVAVSPSYQRQGVGKQLMAYTKSFCLENGFEEAYVQADIIDQHALEFYRKCNPSSESEVIQFSFNLTKP